MGRLNFDSSGKLTDIEGISVEKEKDKDKERKKRLKENSEINQDYYKNENYEFKAKSDNKERFNDPYNERSEVNSKEDSRSHVEDFGLLNNEKIERSGWGGKKNNFSNGNNNHEKLDYSSDNSEQDLEYGDNSLLINADLRKVDSLNFLKDEDSLFKEENYNINEIKNEYWNFYSNQKFLKPLKFSNNKTQEDIVKEVVTLIKNGQKIIFLKGVCGSGKSAIALNIARSLGKTAIVVPLKSLQKQYEDDYSNNKYLIKKDSKRLTIASITGKDNHDSIYKPGLSCADKSLPENIKITEKNSMELKSYYDVNEFNDPKEDLEIKEIKRTWIAPANPYWSPILPIEFELKNLKDAKKYKYEGCNRKEFIFYHRKNGCSYYDQYLAYIRADVLIYNSAKYKSELLLLKKPNTKVDIIDEADEFLDSLFNEKEINLKRFYESLIQINTESDTATELKSKILRLLELEFKNKKELKPEINNQLNDKDIESINKTNLSKIFKILLDNNDLVAEISIEDLNYSNNVIDIVNSYSETINDIYLSYKMLNNNLIVSMVTSDLSGCIEEITSKNNATVFMSGTLHSDEVITNVLGIKDYKIVEAETINQGNLEIIRTGKEFNCQYSSFSQQHYTRNDYLYSVSACINRSKLPLLVHVNAFNDLPSESELIETGIGNLISKDKLISDQKLDKLGNEINRFKNKEIDKIFSTKCSRGIDFPGDICNSILFTKYPNPNINSIFWKILKKTHPNNFWGFYKDKAKREFLQRLYRALRSKEDHIYVLSPDLRVIDAVRELQNL